MGNFPSFQLKGYVLGAAMSTLILGGAACLPKEPVPGEESVGEVDQANGVLAAMASTKEIPMIFRTQGEIVPSNMVKIQATAPGRVDKVSVHEGQKVAAGTVILQYNTELPQRKLELAQAEAEEADAAIDFEQYRFDNRDALLDDEEITSAIYDYIEHHLEYEQTRAKRAKAEVNYLQTLVKDQNVTSPITGTVTARAVADNMPVVEGQFLMEIIEDDPVKLLVRLPEEYIPATYRGQLLQVKFPDERGEVTVKISEVGVAVDPLTETFEVFAQLDNPEGKLKTGMQMETTLITDKKTTILAIPKSSVTLRDNKAVVFRIADGVAQEVQVKLGQPVGQEVAVLDGINEGDIVVVEPPSRMRDGDEVEILTTAARTEPTAVEEEFGMPPVTPPPPGPPRPAMRTPETSRVPPARSDLLQQSRNRTLDVLRQRRAARARAEGPEAASVREEAPPEEEVIEEDAPEEVVEEQEEYYPEEEPEYEPPEENYPEEDYPPEDDQPEEIY